MNEVEICSLCLEKFLILCQGTLYVYDVWYLVYNILKLVPGIGKTEDM